MPMNPRVALWLARAAAWSLLIGGWLVFGALGLFWAPRAEWAFAPLALWMAGIGLVLRASRSLAFTPASGAAALLASAAGGVGALWASMHGGAWAALLVAAPCVSVLLVTASRTVRSLRPGAADRPGRTSGCAPEEAPVGAPAPADRGDSPAGPALAGALAVALLFSDPANPQAVAAAAVVLLLAAAGLLAVLPRLSGARGRRPGTGLSSEAGCRPALFDCSLPGPALWRGAGAARFAMLPMMSSLSWTLAWCQGTLMPPQGMLALHLAAMFLPAFLIQRLATRGNGSAALGTAAAWLMVAGALALFDADPLRALLWASLLQGAAWSLAWLALLAPAGHRPTPLAAQRTSPRSASSGLASALLNAALVAALGAALGRFGLPALVAVHAALGLWAVAGLRPVRRTPSFVVSVQR